MTVGHRRSFRRKMEESVSEHRHKRLRTRRSLERECRVRSPPTLSFAPEEGRFLTLGISCGNAWREGG